MASVCSSPGCEMEAKLRCPTCVKLTLPDDGSYFCSQDCFKRSWKLHKLHHVLSLGKNSGKLLDDREKQKSAFANFPYTGKLRAEYVSPMSKVPDHIQKPDYSETGIPISEEKSKRARVIVQLDEDEIAGMRKVCRLAREVLDVAGHMVKPGITTDEIDQAVHRACLERDSYPSPLNYYNFPKSVCTSVNEVICHGIPDARPLEDGDILNIDITLYHGGFHGDLNETYVVGNVDEAGKKLIKSSYDALFAAIEMGMNRVVRSGLGFVNGLLTQCLNDMQRSQGPCFASSEGELKRLQNQTDIQSYVRTVDTGSINCSTQPPIFLIIARTKP
uniref:C6H2-type domain-containing protein n=1 Tax=Rhodosorus marinus TaxID=101924 RepID=A0A7S3EKX0_9RHOD|mmetsp:Transcript_44093/g.172033  ORF Transcript_44093/g.172033 Transcript_44093/m.172033 type:complete len:331 (+) Transcript_44093:275-1267(+)